MVTLVKFVCTHNNTQKIIYCYVYKLHEILNLVSRLFHPYIIYLFFPFLPPFHTPWGAPPSPTLSLYNICMYMYVILQPIIFLSIFSCHWGSHQFNLPPSFPHFFPPPTTSILIWYAVCHLSFSWHYLDFVSLTSHSHSSILTFVCHIPLS